VTALDKLTHLVGYTATDFLDARFGEDSGPDDIARAIHAEIRAEALREAADLIESEQHRLDDAENARHGALDHESELQHAAVHAMGALLRRVAAGQVASGSQLDTDDTTQPADFFQPGHGYTHRSYGNDFHCVTVTTHPTTGERLAMGWLSEHGEWHRPHVVGINQWNHEYDGAEPPDDHGSIEDAHSATELYEMDRDAEFRHDAEDDARNTAEVEAEERGEA
jgi:hypothetical protein